MRALVCAAVMACVLSGAAQADVITVTRSVSASAASLRNDLALVSLAPFDATLGTFTSATLTFGGQLNTGAQPIRTFPGEPAPATVSLASTVRITVAGASYQ